MRDKLILYRILGFILLPIGALMGIATLLVIPLAMRNLALLLSIFLTGATVIYIFTSLVFLQKGVNKKMPLKPSFKDLVKVNGYVAIFFSILCLVQGIMILANPDVMKMLVDSTMAMQEQVGPMPDKQLYYKTVRVMLYFIVGIGAVLLVHIFQTFRLLRQYAGLFVKE